MVPRGMTATAGYQTVLGAVYGFAGMVCPEVPLVTVSHPIYRRFRVLDTQNLSRNVLAHIKLNMPAKKNTHEARHHERIRRA